MEIKKQEKLLNLSIIASCAFVVTILVSIFLTYNEKNNLHNKAKIDKKTCNNINILNRKISIIILFIFGYINYTNYIDAKEKGKSTKNPKLQLLSNGLLITSSLIVLYVLYNSNNEIIILENPNI